jgi:hypothetical protein
VSAAGREPTAGGVPGAGPQPAVEHGTGPQPAVEHGTGPESAAERRAGLVPQVDRNAGEGASAPRPHRLAELGLLAAVLALALWTRWGWASATEGPRFFPRPDALEYAASAQAIAQTGEIFLQVGPYRVRPRYPPGWPMVLAVAIRLGAPGDGLWRVAGLFGAALAALLALLAARAVQALAPGAGWSGGFRAGRSADEDAGRSADEDAARSADAQTGPNQDRPARSAAGWSAAVAAALAGGGWALAPLAVAQGQTVMSDEPTTLAAVACLALTGSAWLRSRRRREDGDRSETRGGDEGAARPIEWRARGRGPCWQAAAGGFCFGLAAAMRPVAAALLAAPLALLLAGGVRRTGARAQIPRVASWALGAAIFPALTVVLLLRSGLPPLAWSGYRFWVPQRFARLADTFNLRYALHGNPAMPLGSDGRPIPHLTITALVLGGVPTLPPHQVLGLWWPLAGWLAAPWLLHAARRRGGAAAQAAPWLAAALAAWTAGYVAVFSLYFFPAPRFYLGPAALALTLFAVACGAALAAPRPPVRRLAAAAVLAGAALLALAAADFRREPPAPAEEDDPRPAVARWLAQRDAQRAKRVMPFDPVYAQALGLLSPDALRDIETWGRLPPTIHVRRLREMGWFDRATP